ncbi:MAG: hypothetical protein WC453_01305 [Patescibacteria group bacterium]
MSDFRFSPIKSEAELRKAIEYTHIACFQLCQLALGRYLPVAGNIGIFCHDDDEFIFLTALREKLTDRNDNWNQKYFRLHESITIPARGDLPETTYTYLYIRRPDPKSPQIGDVDFVIDSEEHRRLQSLAELGERMNGIDLLYRPDLDMIRLSRPDIDALPYLTTKTMAENVAAALE